MLKNFLKRGPQPPETAGDAVGPASEPIPQQTRSPGGEPPALGAAEGIEPSEARLLAMALELHQAGSLPALVDAATAIAARQLEGAPLLILLKGQRESLTLAGGSSELTTNLHAEINRAFSRDLLHTRLAISGPLLAALTGEPHVRRMSGLAELLGDALGDESCQQADASLETEEVVVVRLEHAGETAGLAAYLTKHRPADLGMVKALADHFAVALSNLRERDDARRYGIIDPIRWVYDEERFLQDLNREVHRASRYGREFAVLLLVVLNLEKLKAEFGPSQANRVLRAVGATISRELRESDTLAAYREDGFGVILPETDTDRADSVANRLKNLASEVNVFASDEPASQIECAVAAAAFPQDGKSAVELAAAAESRLLGLDWPLAKTGSD